tara:strand:- start:13085 stop:19363 length:6279 start_codon:yes stop_codon:yes gene_type:complete
MSTDKKRDKTTFPRNVRRILKSRLSPEQYSNLLDYYVEAGSPDFKFYSEGNSKTASFGSSTFAKKRGGWMNPYDNTIYLNDNLKNNDWKTFRMVFEELGHAQQFNDIKNIESESGIMQFLNTYLIPGDAGAHTYTGGVLSGILNNANEGISDPPSFDNGWNLSEYWGNVFSSTHQSNLYKSDNGNHEHEVHTGERKKELITKVFGEDGVTNYLDVNNNKEKKRGEFTDRAQEEFANNKTVYDQDTQAKLKSIKDGLWSEFTSLKDKVSGLYGEGGFERIGNAVNRVSDLTTFESGGHINATTAAARHKGLEGAKPGTSASLMYTDHKGRTIEGRQSYPVRIYADGSYVGILKPGDTMETFAASRIDEVPAYQDASTVTQVEGGEAWETHYPVNTSYSQYKHIPEQYFTAPTGDFQYTKRNWDTDAQKYGEDTEHTGTYNPDWFTPDFDPYTYYKTDGRTWDDYKASGYASNPYMQEDSSGSSNMEHPLVWGPDKLATENRRRLNNNLLLDIYNEDGSVKEEYQDRIGKKRYLQPFNEGEAPGQEGSEGQFVSQVKEGEGWHNNYRPLEKDGIMKGSIWTKGEDGGWEMTEDLSYKEMVGLYKDYKDMPGFGGISKREWKKKIKEGDVFHPQILSRDQVDNYDAEYQSKMNPISPKDVQLQKDFLDGAINSNLYREKLINAGYEDVDNIIKQRGDALANSNVKYQDNSGSYRTEYKYPEDKSDDSPNWPYTTADKMSLLRDLYKEKGYEYDGMDDIVSMNSNFTTLGEGDTKKSEESYYNKQERQKLLFSRFGGHDSPAMQDAYAKLFGGDKGSRAYTGNHGDKTGDIVLDPREQQQIMIDLGYEGTWEELEAGLSSTSIHEMSHMAGATSGESGMNDTDKDVIIELMEANGIDISTLDPHDGSPYERKADLDAMRFDMFNTIGYDFRESQLTPEVLQQYKEHRKANPKPGLSENRMFKFFNDDGIVKFNNEVADLGEGMPPGMSKYGGATRYRQGSDVQIQEPSLDIQNNKTTSPPVERPVTKEEEYIDFIQGRTAYVDPFTNAEDPEMHFSNAYNSELSADELLEYYIWQDSLAHRRSELNGTSLEDELKRFTMDQGAYDIYGFWKSGDYENTDSDGHGSDRWKKPNHVTFSDESQYASNYNLEEGDVDRRTKYEGGSWNKDGGYSPTRHNMHSTEHINKYLSDGNSDTRQEYLYMGNPRYMKPFSPTKFLSGSDPIPLRMDNTNINLNQGEIPVQTFQDGTDVPFMIDNPLSEEAQAKYKHMYRDRDEDQLSDLTYDFSTNEGYLGFVKRTENSYGAGYDGAKKLWFPHKDSEGNSTIGYGHIVGSGEDYSKGITTEAVTTLLDDDIKVHRDLLERNIEEWDDLGTTERNALLDIQFNIRGNVWTKFPSFTKAVINKDYEALILEGSRAEATNASERNAGFYKSAIEPLVKKWNTPVLNPEHSSHPSNIPAAVQDNTYVAPPVLPIIEKDSLENYQDGTRVQNNNSTSFPSDKSATEIVHDQYANTAINIPNYSDPEIYKYYLEGHNGNLTPTVYLNPDQDEHQLEAVPFLSNNLSGDFDPPNLYRETGVDCLQANGKVMEGCAGGIQLAMEYNTPLSKDGVRDLNGIKGGAWQMHQNIVDAGGLSLFNYSTSLVTDDLRDTPVGSDELYTMYDKSRANFGNEAEVLESTLQTGDYVDLYYNGSDYQAEAQTDGFGSNVNTHAGMITEKGGKKYVTHNVHGKWVSDLLSDVLSKRTTGKDNHQMMIVGGARPKYSTGLVEGVSFNSNGYNKVIEGNNKVSPNYNSLTSMNYLNHLGTTLPHIQDDFQLSDGDVQLVGKAAYGSFGQESTYGEGERYNAKSYFRELLRSGKFVSEFVLGDDALSEGQTQIKYDLFKDNPIFQAYNLNDVDYLYTEEGSSRATALIHSMNLGVINQYFADQNLSDEVKLNMMHLAYNKGIENVIHDFSTKSYPEYKSSEHENPTVTPDTLKLGLETYGGIHLDVASYTFNPHNSAQLVDFDMDKLREGTNAQESYDIETLTGFETGLQDIEESYSLLVKDLGTQYNKAETEIVQKVDVLLKKAKRTKDFKYIQQSKKLLKKIADVQKNFFYD